ncbi:tetratricopeptide repeat protein [Alcanivorax sp. MM125-6]|nr:tetratricopeptide repeat protein [Alcanivorax sp. MM125-6]
MPKNIRPWLLLLALTLADPARAADPRHIQALNDEALSLHAAGDYAQAAQRYRELLPLLDEHFGPDSLEAARIRASLADTQLARKQFKDAEASYRDVLAAPATDQHPLLRADALNGLASALYMRRQYGKAEPLYQQARKLLEAQPSPPPERLALVLDNLSSLYRTLRRDAQAERYDEQARKLRRQQNSAAKDHP